MKTNDFKSKTRISIVIMKMFVVMAMFILSYSSLYAQKCNLKTIKDEYASPPSVSVVSEDITLGGAFRVLGDALPWHLDMKFFLDNGQLSILITHHQSHSEGTSLLNSIFFVFKDGTVIRKEEPIGSNDFSAAGTLTGFVLTKEELQFFASKDLMKFKVEFKFFPERPIFENEIKQKSIDIIRKDASCILSEYNTVNNVNSNSDKTIKENTKYVCKYTKDEIDAFTKKRTVYSNNEILHDVSKDGKRMWLNVFAVNINGTNNIQLEYGFMCNNEVDKAEVQTLLKFDQIDLLLDNEKVLTLKDGVMPKFNIESNYFICYKLFSVNDSTWVELKNSPLKKLRLSFNDVEKAQQVIDPKYSKSLMNVINCIDALGIPKSK